MAFPETKDFREFLANLSLDAPRPDLNFEAHYVSNTAECMDENGNVFIQGCQKIFYPTQLRLRWDAVFDKLKTELRQRGHISNDTTAGLIMAIFCSLPRAEDSSVEIMNFVLEQFGDIDVNQYYVFPKFENTRDTLQSFRLGQFDFGSLRSERLEYQCKRADSDYFVRYEQKLRGRLCIERKHFKTVAVDVCPLWRRFPGLVNYEVKLTPQGVGMTAFQAAVDNYYRGLAEVTAESFFDALLEEQHLFLAIGAPYLDERTLRQVPHSDLITVFLNIGVKKAGFVAPLGIGNWVKVQFSNLDEIIPSCINDLRTQFEFTDYTDWDLHQSIRSFALFMSKARRHEIDERIDEAFLHYIIALDLMFGVKEKSTESVANRVAFLVHGSFGKSFDGQRKRVKEFYDTRSKYVHKGEKVDSSLLSEVCSVCREVLHSLLRLNRERDAKDGDCIDDWIGQIDYFAKGLEIGKNPTPSELKSLGVMTSNGGDRE